MATRRFYVSNFSNVRFFSDPIGPNKESCKCGFMGNGFAAEELLMSFLMANSHMNPFASLSTMHLSHVSYANGTITW
jgi:hypothetical protein